MQAPTNLVDWANLGPGKAAGNGTAAYTDLGALFQGPLPVTVDVHPGQQEQKRRELSSAPSFRYTPEHLYYTS